MKPANRKLLNILLWILVTPIVLVLSFLVLLVGSWLLIPDEPLDPLTARLVSYRTSVPVAENVYFAMWGFKASPALDPHQVGQQIVAAYAAHPRGEKGGEPFKADAYWGATPFKRPEKTTAACRPEAKSCLDELKAGETNLDARLAEYAPYVARYRALRGYPHFAEAMEMSIDYPILQWADILFVSDLIDAQVARDMAFEPRRVAALNELSAEIAFWKNLGLEADTLITKMIVVSVLTRKFRLGSELLSRYPVIATTHAETVAAMTRPLSPEWAHMERVMDGEFRFFASALSKLPDTEQNIFFDNNAAGGMWRSAVTPLNAYRVNATLNEHRRMTSRVGDFYSQSARAIVENEAAFRLEQDQFNPWSPDTIFYNPVGKIVVNIAAPAWGEYAYRLQDMIGLSRLVELQRRLALAQGTPEEIGKQVAADPALFDPYTEKPMQWSAASGELRFAARGLRLRNSTAVVVKVGQ